MTLAHLVDSLPPTGGRVQADAPLAPHTWFRVGGPAEALVRPSSAQDLARFLGALPHAVPVLVLGAASNVIVRDGGVPGVVLRLGRGFGDVRIEPDGIVAGAACLDATVAEHAAAAGLTGLEFLSGIPGTIGGAVAMNAGAYGGDIASCLDWAEVVTRSGEQRRIPAAGLALAYRTARLPPGAVVTRARLRARPGAPAAIAAAMATIRTSREATQPRARPHRRIDVPQPRRHEGVGADRRRRPSRPGAGRRDGQRQALQLPAEHRGRHGREPGRPLARPCAAGCRRPRACCSNGRSSGSVCRNEAGHDAGRGPVWRHLGRARGEPVVRPPGDRGVDGCRVRRGAGAGRCGIWAR